MWRHPSRKNGEMGMCRVLLRFITVSSMLCCVFCAFASALNAHFSVPQSSSPWHGGESGTRTSRYEAWLSMQPKELFEELKSLDEAERELAVSHFRGIVRRGGGDGGGGEKVKRQADKENPQQHQSPNNAKDPTRKTEGLVVDNQKSLVISDYSDVLAAVIFAKLQALSGNELVAEGLYNHLIQEALLDMTVWCEISNDMGSFMTVGKGTETPDETRMTEGRQHLLNAMNCYANRRRAEAKRARKQTKETSGEEESSPDTSPPSRSTQQQQQPTSSSPEGSPASVRPPPTSTSWKAACEIEYPSSSLEQAECERGAKRALRSACADSFKPSNKLSSASWGWQHVCRRDAQVDQVEDDAMQKLMDAFKSALQGFEVDKSISLNPELIIMPEESLTVQPPDEAFKAIWAGITQPPLFTSEDIHEWWECNADNDAAITTGDSVDDASYHEEADGATTESVGWNDDRDILDDKVEREERGLPGRPSVRGDNLLKWARTMGAPKLDAVVREGVPDMGNGVYSTRRVQADTVVLSVPSRLVLSSAKSLDSDVGHLLTPITEKSVGNRFGHVRLAVLLIREMHRIGPSFWQPYLDILPKADELSYLPTYYDNSMLKSMAATPLYASRERNLDLAKTICDFLEKFHTENPLLLPPADIHLCLWSVAVIQSRAWKTEREGSCLIPLADMLNHHPEGKYLVHRPDETEVIYTAFKREKGEQLFDNYGLLPASTFMNNFGFHNRDMHVVNFVVHPRKESSLIQPLVDRLLMTEGCIEGKTFNFIKGSRKFPDEFVKCIRIRTLNKDEWNVVYDKANNVQVSELGHQIVSLQNEFGWTTEFAANLAKALSAYPTSVETDRELLENPICHLSPTRRILVQYRMYEKLVYLEGIDVAKSYLKNATAFVNNQKENSTVSESADGESHTATAGAAVTVKAIGHKLELEPYLFVILSLGLDEKIEVFMAITPQSSSRHAKPTLVDGQWVLPPPSHSLVESGRRFRSLMKLEEAVKQFKMALEVDISNSIAWFELGITEMLLGNFLHARARLSKGLEYHDDDPPASIYFFLGVTHQIKNQMSIAQEWFEKAVNVSADYAQAHNGIALTHLTNGNLDKCVEILTGLVTDHPDNSEIRHNYGVALAIKGLYADALTHLRIAMEDSYFGSRTEGIIIDILEDHASAEDLVDELDVAIAQEFKLAFKGGGDAQAAQIVEEYSEKLIKRGELLPAARLFAIAQRYVSMPELHLREAILRRHCGDSEGAVEVLTAARALALTGKFMSADVDGSELIQVIDFNLALSLIESDDPVDMQYGLEKMHAILDEDPFQLSAWYNVGVVLSRLERREEAVDAMLTVIAIEEEYFEARNNLAAMRLQIPFERLTRDHHLVYVQQGELLQARELLEEELPMGHSVSRYNLGVVCELLGETDLAVAHWSASLSLGLDAEFLWKAHANLGWAHHRRSDFAQAAAGYENALKQPSVGEEASIVIRSRLSECLFRQGKTLSAAKQLAQVPITVLVDQKLCRALKLAAFLYTRHESSFPEELEDALAAQCRT